MKEICYLVVLLVFVPASLWAQDLRAVQQQVSRQRQQLEARAAAEKEQAQAAAEASRQQILNDRVALDRELTQLQERVSGLRRQVAGLEQENGALSEQDRELNTQLAAADGMVREVVGNVRLHAKDLLALVQDNLQTGVSHPDLQFLQGISGLSRFPGMADIGRMVDLLFAQLHGSGEVDLREVGIIDRSGHEVQARVLTLGPFSALYQLGDEVGYLNYGGNGDPLFALSRLPAGRQQRAIRSYLQGESDAVPLDVSRGAALQQLVHHLSLWQQIGRGGLLVWPILVILAAGLGIILERVLFLLRKRFDGDGLLGQIETLVQKQDWAACKRLCSPYAGKPVARVLQAGLHGHAAAREDMEDMLQEAILRELPAFERFLAALGMLAAIAPLLGLLGTVTGMIDTFQVMTQFGTGDPRLMSSGISVALVTTMLGLTVAIPIMLAHTLLGRAVDNAVGQLEEKAVALVNIVHKYR